MSAPLQCPGFDTWQVLFDDAPAGEWERFERHLESCPDCQARLDRDEGQLEMLRRAGRQFGDPTRIPCDPTLAEVLDRLLEGTPPGRTDLYFLGPPPREDLLGTLGDYEVSRVIGEGGMGVVLEAYEPALHRPVAIKVLAPALAGSATARKRFTREARAAAAVCHEHVVAVHGVNEVGGLPYLVMQYVAGESLQDRLDRNGPLEVEEVVRIGMQTAAGLAAAHAQGLIHRDIKPANLLLENGLARVKITDFGLARMVDDVGLTQTGFLAGTPEYMAPEQARAAPVDHRADLFSLGSVLYALCAGRPPFRGSTTLAVLRCVCDEEPPPLRQVNPDVPAWLEQVIARLMAKDPAHRFGSAAEVAGLLEGYLAHLRQPATLVAPSLPPTHVAGPPRARNWTRWVIAALVLVALLGLLRLVPHPAGPGVDASRGGVAENLVLRTEYPEDFRPTFEGLSEKVPGLVVFGPEPSRCVKFEPGGLHIILPPTYPRDRQGTGVASDFGVRGDFEITVSYEILQEPRPGTQANPTDLRLVVVPADPVTPGLWHKTSQNRAVLARETPRFHMAAQFVADATRWNNLDLPRDQWGNEMFDKIEQHTRQAVRAEARTGRLRLVRSGPRLHFFISEGAASDFTLLQTSEFSTTDLRDVRILGTTGGPGTFLDVRISDVRIRAEALLRGTAATARLAPAPAQRKGLLAVLTLAGLSLAGVLSWGAWRYARRRRAVPVTEVMAPSPVSAIVFGCPGCSKRLRARTEMAGKKLKCPQCSEGVIVPDARRENHRSGHEN